MIHCPSPRRAGDARRALGLATAFGLGLSALAFTGDVRAQGPAVHPIWSALPDLPHAEDAQRAFSAAAARYRMGTVEVLDVSPGPASKVAARLDEGKAALRDLRLPEATAALDAAVAEVTNVGVAGLGEERLADLFLNQAWTAQRADWKDLPAPVTSLEPPTARTAYLRAAVLTPNRVLGPRQFPPLVMESWRLATAEVKARPRGAVVVRASANALVSVDGRPPQSPPVAIPDLLYGDHFVRVDEPGRRSWSVVAPLAGPTFELDVPLQPSLALEDPEATTHGRRMEAAFVLVGELKPPAPPEAQQLELRLIDVASGERRDATTVPFPGDPAALEAAVMRLDELARRGLMERGGGSRVAHTDLFVEPALPPPPDATSAAPAPDRDPKGWARRRWPLLAAVGAALTAALVLGFVATRDR